MKRIVFCALLALTLCPGLVSGATALLKITGAYKDVIVSNPQFGYTTTGTASGSLTATLPLNGFDVSSLDDTSPLIITVGNSTIKVSSLGEATSYAPDKQTAQWTDDSSSLTLSWTANAVTITDTAKYDVFGLYSIYGAENSAIRNDPVNIRIDLGDFSFLGTLYLSGTASTKTVTEGSGDKAQSLDLSTISVSGAADLTSPTVTITSPKPNLTVTSANAISLGGKATDANGVSEVDFCVTSSPVLTGTEAFQPAELAGTNGAWSASFSPAPGTNYIFVTATDDAGNVSAPVKRMVYYLRTSPIGIQVVEGNGSFGNIANGQLLEIGRAYTLTAKPSPGQVFANWSASDGTSGYTTTFPFTMQEGLVISLHFRNNPFPSLKGTYTGLFYDSANGLNLTNAGTFTLTLTTNGAYSGKVNLLAGAIPFSGQLGISADDSTSAVAEFGKATSKTTAVSGFLYFDLAGSGAVSGQVNQLVRLAGASSLDYSISLSASVEGQLCQPATKAPAQLYNIAYSGDSGALGNNSFGSATVAGNGTVKLTFNLADKIAPVTAGAALCNDGRFPLFAPLYAKKGVVLGWLNTVSNGLQTDLSGDNIQVFKLATSTNSSFFPNATSSTLSAQGSAYAAPKNGTNLLGWTSGQVSLGDGSFSAATTFNPAKNQFTFSASDNPNKVSLTLAPASGQLSGSFVPTDSKKAVKFKGLILPAQGAGFGFYTGTDGVGGMQLLENAGSTVGVPSLSSPLGPHSPSE